MGFESYHPAINFIFFASVIAGTVCFNHPAFLAISWVCAFLYSVKRNGVKALIFDLVLIPLILVFASYYSGYTHFGLTVWRQNFIGNNMTMESFVYGVTLGGIVASAVMWFSCMFSIFTADKVVYLFGKINPHFSLALSIVLRMVPRMKQEGKKISAARKAIGRGINQGNPLRRFLNVLTIISMVITWLLESFGTISDSMRSRGYSLRGRTAFSIYRFDNRDRSFVIAIFFCLVLLLMAVLLGQTRIIFDPRIIMKPFTPLTCLFCAGYAALCLMPMALELASEYSFRKSRRAL